MLSTEGTEWFGPEKLTEVIDIYENSQMYLPGKYSRFSGTGSAKPGDKFVKRTHSLEGDCFALRMWVVSDAVILLTVYYVT